MNMNGGVAVGSKGPRGSIEPMLACKELFNQLVEIRKNAQSVEIDLQLMTQEVKHIAYQHQHYHPPRNPVESPRDFRVSLTESMNQFPPPPRRGGSPTTTPPTSFPPPTPPPNARATYDNKPSIFERFYQGLEQQKISPITSPTLQPPLQEPLSEYTSPSYRTNYPRSSTGRNQHYFDSPVIEVIDVEDDQVNQQQQQQMELSEEIESIHPRRYQHQSDWDFLSVSRSMPYPLPPCVTGQVPVLDNKYVPCVVDDATKPFVVIRVAAPATSFSRCICMLLTANGPAEQLLGYRPVRSSPFPSRLQQNSLPPPRSLL